MFIDDSSKLLLGDAVSIQIKDEVDDVGVDLLLLFAVAKEEVSEAQNRDLETCLASNRYSILILNSMGQDIFDNNKKGRVLGNFPENALKQVSLFLLHPLKAVWLV